MTEINLYFYLLTLKEFDFFNGMHYQCTALKYHYGHSDLNKVNYFHFFIILILDNINDFCWAKI